MAFNHKFAGMKLFRCMMPVLLVLLGIVCLSGCQSVAVIVEGTHPVSGGVLGAWGWVGVTFSMPMDPETVQSRFSISPDIPGVTFWQGNTFWFRPTQPFAPGETYEARLVSGATTVDGDNLKNDWVWSFQVRQPLLVFYVPVDGGGELWRVGLDGEMPQPLTQTSGRVYDFAPDRTGEWIVFSVLNDWGGQDVWWMTREGSAAETLVDCGQDRCYQPAWSVDSAFVAYAREAYDSAEGRYSPSQVWMVDVASGETTRLYQSDAAFGHSPSFSPDGQRLVTYDLTHKGMRFLNLETSQEAVIPRVLQGVGDWSPDGSEMIFRDLIPAETEPDVMVYVVDLEAEVIAPAFGEVITGTDFSTPRWSPGGGWAAVSLRPVNAAISKALWLLKLGSGEAQLVADEPAATFSAYRWDPWGMQLVYQRLALGGPDHQPSLWIWDWESGESRLLVQAGARPEWLP